MQPSVRLLAAPAAWASMSRESDMAKLSKRAAAIAAKIERNKFYPVSEALSLVKETATAKFDESIDVAVQLGIDPRKSDQLVRGSVVLPAEIGRASCREGGESSA